MIQLFGAERFWIKFDEARYSRVHRVSPLLQEAGADRVFKTIIRPSPLLLDTRRTRGKSLRAAKRWGRGRLSQIDCLFPSSCTPFGGLKERDKLLIERVC